MEWPESLLPSVKQRCDAHLIAGQNLSILSPLAQSLPRYPEIQGHAVAHLRPLLPPRIDQRNPRRREVSHVPRHHRHAMMQRRGSDERVAVASGVGDVQPGAP